MNCVPLDHLQLDREDDWGPAQARSQGSGQSVAAPSRRPYQTEHDAIAIGPCWTATSTRFNLTHGHYSRSLQNFQFCRYRLDHLQKEKTTKFMTIFKTDTELIEDVYWDIWRRTAGPNRSWDCTLCDPPTRRRSELTRLLADLCEADQLKLLRLKNDAHRSRFWRAGKKDRLRPPRLRDPKLLWQFTRRAFLGGEPRIFGGSGRAPGCPMGSSTIALR